MTAGARQTGRMTVFIDVLLIAAILGTGIVAGVFYAFSGFVTQGLDRLPPRMPRAPCASSTSRRCDLR